MSEKKEDVFELLVDRVLDGLEKTDLERINFILENIKGPTLVTGVGGSSVVSTYLSKILENKNGIVAINKEPRDVLYMNTKPYKNIVCCSYSGKNYGVELSFSNNLEHYLFSKNQRDDIHNLTYVCDEEKSFISLSATLLPMAIALNYYLDHNPSFIKEILMCEEIPCMKSNTVFEIMSGYDNSTASTFLESTLTESGIAIPIVHDKYAYCHGRSTISYKNSHSLIYLNTNTKLDQLLLEQLKPYYQQIIPLNLKYQDPLINDFYFTYQSMLLTKELAAFVQEDLAHVQYSPVVKKLYKYKGGM